MKWPGPPVTSEAGARGPTTFHTVGVDDFFFVKKTSKNKVARLRDCCVARLRYYCITMLRYCCVARLRDCCVEGCVIVVLQGCVIVLLRARLRDCCVAKVARLRDCAMLILKISAT
jgi:hypothetical protein